MNSIGQKSMLIVALLALQLQNADAQEFNVRNSRVIVPVRAGAKAPATGTLGRLMKAIAISSHSNLSPRQAVAIYSSDARKDDKGVKARELTPAGHYFSGDLTRGGTSDMMNFVLMGSVPQTGTRNRVTQDVAGVFAKQGLVLPSNADVHVAKLSDKIVRVEYATAHNNGGRYRTTAATIELTPTTIGGVSSTTARILKQESVSRDRDWKPLHKAREVQTSDAKRILDPLADILSNFK